jgi:DNA-binding response OmpR family regulator
MTQYQLLLVEDEPHLAFSLNLNLTAEGYSVVHVADGHAALQTFNTKGPFDAVIVDGMLPGLDGFDVAKGIRAQNSKVGILMLTARTSEHDRLRGFEVGVDDYIAKPFSLQELLARVRRACERTKMFAKTFGQEDIVRFGDCELDSPNLLLRKGGTIHEVTKLEADFLRHLLRHADQVVSREDLLATVWGVASQVESRTVDNFVVRLRKMIEDNPKEPKFLLSIRGRGYKIALTPGSEKDGGLYVD